MQVNSLVHFLFLWHSVVHMAKGKSLPSNEAAMPWFDAAMEDLATYLRSSEGERWFSDLESLMERIQTRSKFQAISEVSLTQAEARALEFVRNEHAEGRSPGVRKIAKAAGFKSSRSGLKLLRSLEGKGLLR